MTVHDKLNCDEKKAVEEFQERMKEHLPSKMYEDNLLCYRFMKARDFDIEKAEIMLRKHLIWRKAFQVDNFLKIFKPTEVFERYITPSIIGYDKEGDVVTYMPVGKLEMREVCKCLTLNDYEKNVIYFTEKLLVAENEENARTGRSSYQGSMIFDLDQLTFSNATYKSSAEIFLRISCMLQDNYPEYQKSVFVINAPAYYVFVYSLLKKVMSNAMIKKIKVFGKNDWKKYLLKVIDADVLPAFLGGNRTDPDGNPLCLTFVTHGCTFSPKYYISSEERWFKDKTMVKRLLIPPRERSRVFVEVKEHASIIRWEFESKGKDIGFGLFLQEDNDELEVLPIMHFNTSDGTEKSSYKTQSIGKYVIIFDNTYSWLTSKEVHYCVTVLNQET